VDASNPTYNTLKYDFGNPTDGSLWMLQVQPTKHLKYDFGNPTDGSLWMLQVLPTKTP